MKSLNRLVILLLFILLRSWAAQAQYSMEEYRTGYESAEPTKRDGITEIYFVGTGDVQFGYSDRTTNKGIAANTGLGVLFWRIWQYGHELQLDAKITIASTVDTISAVENNGVLSSTRQFGRYLLIPAGSGQATQINALYYFYRPPSTWQPALQRQLRDLDRALRQQEQDSLRRRGQLLSPTTRDSLRLAKALLLDQRATVQQKLDAATKPKPQFRFISGIECSGAASNQVWAATSPTTNGVLRATRSVNISAVAWRLGVFHDFMPQELARQKGYAIRLGLNFIGRSLQGDIGLRTDAMQKLRREFLGGTSTTYWGGELLLALRLKNIRAEASLPYVFRRNTETIAGLTGTQFFTSISFVGGFPLNIGKASN